MAHPTEPTQLETLLTMLTPEQFNDLVDSLSDKGLSDDIVAAEGEVDEATLQVVAEEVWEILEKAA